MRQAVRSVSELGPTRRALRRLRDDRAAMTGLWLLLGIGLLCFVVPAWLGLDPTTTEQVRVRAPGTLLLEAADAESALLAWVDARMTEWAEAGLLTALDAVVRGQRPEDNSGAEAGDEVPEEEPTEGDEDP